MKGLSSFDQPHALLWRVNYETTSRPMQSGWIGRILGQWQISSIILLKSGTPFRVRTGSDAPGFGNVDGAGNDNPILLDPSILGRTINNPDTSQKMLPQSAFSFIEPTDLRGNLGRNTFRKDGIWERQRWTLAEMVVGRGQVATVPGRVHQLPQPPAVLRTGPPTHD